MKNKSYLSFLLNTYLIFLKCYNLLIFYQKEIKIKIKPLITKNLYFFESLTI